MADVRADLRADCIHCVGLRCVAPAFSASADFAIDKAAGWPCLLLGADCSCSIHTELRVPPAALECPVDLHFTDARGRPVAEPRNF